MIFLVSGGPRKFIPDLKKIHLSFPDAKWCGIDGGTLHLLKCGITPTYAVGDFDSITNEELEHLKSKIKTIVQLPAEKDLTDLEAALEYVCSNSTDDIIIFGATGGRIDHAFANIMITQRYIDNRAVTLIDNQNELRMLRSGTYTFDKNNMKYISFLPISEKLEKVTLSGMKYTLNEATLLRDESLGVSNEITHSKGHISFESGICLVVRSKD